jgi:transcription termination factor Rho
MNNHHDNDKNGAPPVIDIAQFKGKRIAELTTLAKSLGITNFADLRKQELILKIVEAQTNSKPVANKLSKA